MRPATKRQARIMVVTIAAVFCLLGMIYSVTIPLFEAPDEVWHFSFIHKLATEHALPVQSTTEEDVWLRESGQPPFYQIMAALLITPLDLSDFPAFVRFNPDHPFVTPFSTSQAPNLFIHTDHEAFPYQGAVLAAHLVRLLSVLWGTGAVVGVYLVASQVTPLRPGLALAAMAVTAFNPQFIFISSVINNDAAAAGLSTWTLWLAIRMAKGGTTHREDAVLGGVLGLALLGKLSALALLPLMLVALGLRWQQERQPARIIRSSAIIFGLAFLLAGWWYLRNWQLYGDPLGLNVWFIHIDQEPLTPVALLYQFPEMLRSFWQPYAGLLPAAIFWLLGAYFILAVGGWLRLIGAYHRGQRPAHPLALLIAGIWFIAVFVSLVRFMMLTPAAQGRLLFPAVATISVLLVLGLDAILPRAWSRPAGNILAAALLLLSAVIPFTAIAPHFPSPRLAAADLPELVPLEEGTMEDITVQTGVRLLGVTVEPAAALPNQDIMLTLFWQVEQPPPIDLRVVLQLWSLGGRLLNQEDRPPAKEVYPPDLWQAGDIIRDAYRLQIRGGGTAAYYIATQVWTGELLAGEVATPAVFKVSQAVELATITHPLTYRFGEQIELIGYDWFGPDDEGAMALTFYWRAVADVTGDYNLFLHLIDEEGALVTQQDGPPLAYDYPTSRWRAGEVLEDRHVILLPADRPENGRWRLGLYQPADGMRLAAYGASGRPLPDNAVILSLPPP